MSQLISKDQIKRQAVEAAERGDLPAVCPYIAGSDAERAWKDAYYIRVYQLAGEESA